MNTKKKVDAEIIKTINRICTNDPDCCSFGFCKFNKKCAKPFYEEEGLPKITGRSKKRIINNLIKADFKRYGKPWPFAVSRKVINEINGILGECILEHELVKGDPVTISKIKACLSFRQINKVLEEKYNSINKKKISLPGQSRDFYRKYLNENATQNTAPQPGTGSCHQSRH